jgi:hypothetical protein
MEEKGNLPVPPSFLKMLGPSIVLLGLGLGSGELILWPYLVTRFGLGIIWAAFFGFLAQFFMNMEIERYSLAKGESVFAGFSRFSRAAPWWFLFSTFFAWVWPGIIGTSAKIFSDTFGFARYEYLAIVMLILIGLVLTISRKLYRTIELWQKLLIGIGVPIILIITLYLAKSSDWRSLYLGLAGVGEGYRFLPYGLPFFTFLGAVAYAGAGGNLNLAQSFYIKEKGFGMCKGTKGISSVLYKYEKPDIFGRSFEPDSANLKLFSRWWRLTNWEHFIAFFVTGVFTVLLMSLLAFATLSSSGAGSEGIGFIKQEAEVITSLLSSGVGLLFLLVVALMLFNTQLMILDSTSRIIAENVVVLKDKLNLSKTYYFALWIQILGGIIIFLVGFAQPFTLIIISAVINAVAMFVHLGATYILNIKALPEILHPSVFRRVILALTWLFFGGFSFYAIYEGLTKFLSG